MVLDWFLLEGGHPLYESPPDDGEVQLNPDLYEVRFPDLEVFVGPPTEDGLGSSMSPRASDPRSPLKSTLSRV